MNYKSFYLETLNITKICNINRLFGYVEVRNLKL